MEDRIISYAQNQEDVILSGFFKGKSNGFYVDVGASHPVVSSVTKLFYEKGWRGINIEPNRKYYDLLVSDRPEDINLNVGVADKPGKLPFREYKGFGYSTFSEEIKKEHEENKDDLTESYVDYEVPVTTLKDIFKDQNVKTINFLKIDIEGFEYEALIGNDWSKYRPEVICIESNHMVRDWRPLLKKYKYEKAFFDGLNDYYVASEKPELIKNFSYAESVLLEKPIIPLQWHQELGRANARVRKAELETQTERNKNYDLQREIDYLKAHIQNQSNVRKQVKSLLRSIDNSTKLRIEKLNRSKRRKASKLAALDINRINSASPKELVEIAQENDLKSFYTNKGSGGYSTPYAYLLSHLAYDSLRSVAKSIYHVSQKDRDKRMAKKKDKN